MNQPDRNVIQLAARLALSDCSREPPPLCTGNIREIVHALAMYRIPLCEIDERQHPETEWLFKSPPYQELYAKHADRRRYYEEGFRTFMRFASATSISVLVLKACDYFPYESSNLDLLIKPARMIEAVALLEEAGFHTLHHYTEPHKILCKKLSPKRDPVTFHLHEEISWQGAIFLARDNLWLKKRPLHSFDGASQLSYEHLLAHTIAHSVYENARVRIVDLRRALKCINSGLLDLEEVVNQAKLWGWISGLKLGVRRLISMERSFCNTDRIRTTLMALVPVETYELSTDEASLSRVRSRVMLASKIVKSKAESFNERAKALIVYMTRKVRSTLQFPEHSGALVALSGVDGSGKSYYGQALARALDACDFRLTRLWARGGSTKITLLLKQIIRKTPVGHKFVPIVAEGKALKNQWQQVLWPWMVCIELTLTYVCRIAVPLLFRRIVICDRYVLDAAVDLAVRLDSNDVWQLTPLRILTTIAPRPVVHLMFDVDPETATSRKNLEMDLESIEKRTTLYHELAPSDIRIVNTVRHRDDVETEVIDSVLNAINRNSE